MPSRWCQCTGCSACRTASGTHGILFDRDTTGTMRCSACQAVATAKRNARPGSSARGLGWAFSRRKQADQNYQAATRCQCPGRPHNRCTLHTGVCAAPFTRDNPKTGGHAVPRSQGGGDGPVLAVCARCNSSDGGARAGRRS
jgi:hypothetical protein